jgi:PAS domain S-box-containing protein
MQGGPVRRIEINAVVISILACAIFWTVDAGLDSLSFYEGSYLDLLFREISTREFLFRSLMCLAFLACGITIHITMLRRKRAEKALSRRDSVLEAVGTASGKFLRQDPTNENIREVLGQLGRATSVSRVYIYENYEDESGDLFSQRKYDWVEKGILPWRGDKAINQFPLFSGGMDRWGIVLSHHGVISGLLTNFPESEQKFLRRHKIKSILVIPIFVGDRWWGFIGFDECKGKFTWSTEVEAIKAAVDILGAAIERQETETALKASEERYWRFFDEDLTGDYICTIDGELLACNPSFAKMLGFDSVEEAKSYTMMNAFPNPQARESFLDLLRTEGRLENRRAEYRRRDGQPVFVVENAVALLNKDNELVGVKGYIFDDTGRKKLEEQLLQSQKMEAVGRLAGGVAHDFNNILTSVIGYSDILLKKLPDDDALCRSVEEIKKGGQRAAHLTQQLLAFSRKQVLEKHVLCLDATINDMYGMLRRLIGENIELSTDLKQIRVEGDPGQIQQVIMNLVVNAKDAMPEGGKISIRTEQVTIDEEYCRVSPDASPGEFVCLSVADTGTGMDKETLAHAFEPFYTTKESGKGTGLGLPVVYGIVKQHNGWINVYSEPNHGTVFKVYLPVTIEDDKKSKEAAEQDAPVGSGERILLVEDEDGLREFATEALTEHGYEVFAAASAGEALRTFHKEQGQFDVVFSDVVLPDRSGLEIASEVLMRDPDMPFLLTSGYTDQQAQWSEVCEKGLPFLQKPYSLRDLLNAINRVIYKAGLGIKRFAA